MQFAKRCITTKKVTPSNAISTAYHIFRANEMPELETIFVETFEPSHPFGVKAVAEIPIDGVAPAVGNAVLDANGVNVDDNPITPEKVWSALKSAV